MSDQEGFAERLLHELAVSGVGDDLDVWVLLDSLACAGLQLAEGVAASDAYLAAVRGAA